MLAPTVEPVLFATNTSDISLPCVADILRCIKILHCAVFHPLASIAILYGEYCLHVLQEFHSVLIVPFGTSESHKRQMVPLLRLSIVPCVWECVPGSAAALLCLWRCPYALRWLALDCELRHQNAHWHKLSGIQAHFISDPNVLLSLTPSLIFWAILSIQQGLAKQKF